MALEFPSIPLEQFRPVTSTANTASNLSNVNSELLKYLSSYQTERRDMKIRVEFPPIFSSTTSNSTWLSTRKVAAELRQQDKELKEQQKEIHNPWLSRGSDYHPESIAEKLRNVLTSAGNVKEVEERIPLPLSEEIPVNKTTKFDMVSQVRQGSLLAGYYSPSFVEDTPEPEDDVFIVSSLEEMTGSCSSISSGVQPEDKTPKSLAEKVKEGLLLAGGKLRTNVSSQELMNGSCSNIFNTQSSVTEDNSMKSLADGVKEGLLLAGGKLDANVINKNYMSSQEEESERCSNNISYPSSSVIEDTNLKSMTEKVREGLLMAGGQLVKKDFIPTESAESSSPIIDMSKIFANIYSSESLSESIIEQDEQQAATSPAETLNLSMLATKSIENVSEVSELEDNLASLDDISTASDLGQWVVADIGDTQSEASIVTLDTLADDNDDFDDFLEIENELSQWRL